MPTEFSAARLSVYIRAFFSLPYIARSPPRSIRRSDTFHMPLSASLPTHPPLFYRLESILPSSLFGGTREEKTSERAYTYVRPHYPRSRRVPRSLIVHRNRNCVPASHARGLPRSRNVHPVRSDMPLFAPGLNPLVCIVLDAGHQQSPVTLRDGTTARSTNRTSVSRASSALVIDLSMPGHSALRLHGCAFISRPLKAPTLNEQSASHPLPRSNVRTCTRVRS